MSWAEVEAFVHEASKHQSPDFERRYLEHLASPSTPNRHRTTIGTGRTLSALQSGSVKFAWPQPMMYFWGDYRLWLWRTNNRTQSIATVEDLPWPSSTTRPALVTWPSEGPTVVPLLSPTPVLGGASCAGPYKPISIDDNGIAIGNIAYGCLQGDFGTELETPFFLDVTKPNPQAVSVPVGATGELLAISPKAGYAVGYSADFSPESVTCDYGFEPPFTLPAWDSYEHSLIGPFASPGYGPSLFTNPVSVRYYCGGGWPMSLNNPFAYGGSTLLNILDSGLLRAVNDKGDAVGVSGVQIADGLNWYPDIREVPVYVTGGSAIDLSPYLGSSRALDINNRGDILASNGLVLNLGSGTSRYLQDWYDAGSANINNLGYVFGHTFDYWGKLTAAVWAPDGTLWLLSAALATGNINDKNEVVGSGCTNTYGFMTCFAGRWQIPKPVALDVIVSQAGVLPPVQASDFSVLPSVFSSSYSPYGAGAQNIPMDVYCVRPDTGDIVPNCTVTLDWAAKENSGGHLHNTNRPPGLVLTHSAARLP
jgi:hypothetical protein